MEKMIRREEMEYETDRRTAVRLRKLLVKILTKDEKSDGVSFSYTYRPFRKRVELVVGGDERLVLKCLKAFRKFVLRTNAEKEKREAAKNRAVPMKKGSYYALKPLKARNKRRL